MSTLAHYSSDKWEWIWSLPDGESLSFEGLSRGSFAVESLATATYSHKELLNGDGVRTFVAGSSGTLSFLVDQNTALHKALIALYVQDRNTRKVAGTLTGTLIGPFGIAKKYFYRGAYIMTLPTESHADTSQDATWVMQFTSHAKTIPVDSDVLVA